MATVGDVAVADSAVHAVRVADVATGATLYTSVVLNDAPLAYYPLNDPPGSATAADLSGNGRTGTINSGVTLGKPGLLTPPCDPAGAAMHFNQGATSYIALPTSGLPSGSQPWSLECWASLDSPLQSNRGTLIGFGQYGPPNQSMGVLQFYATAPDQWVLTCYSFDIGGPTNAVPPNTPFHVVGTYDGTSGHTHLYANGQLLATSTATVSLTIATPAPFATIGAGNVNGVSDRLLGTLQHCAIYGYALSAAQISRHYQAGAAPVAAGRVTIADSALHAVKIGDMRAP